MPLLALPSSLLEYRQILHSLSLSGRKHTNNYLFHYFLWEHLQFMHWSSLSQKKEDKSISMRQTANVNIKLLNTFSSMYNQIIIQMKKLAVRMWFLKLLVLGLTQRDLFLVKFDTYMWIILGIVQTLLLINFIWT